MIYTISINIRSVFEFSTRTTTVHACNYLRQMVNSSLVKFLGGTRYFQFWSSSDVIRFLCRSLRQWVSNSLADTNLMSQKVQLKSSSSTKHGHKKSYYCNFMLNFYSFKKMFHSFGCFSGFVIPSTGANILANLHFQFFFYYCNTEIETWFLF